MIASHLYLVCDERSDGFLHAALRGGVDMVQLRMKSASDQHVLETAARYLAICGSYDVPLILNDRPDLAMEVGADGVHIGQEDMTVATAREIVTSARIVGLSTHTPAQIDAANELGVDYIGVGPVYATPTKPGRPAVGTELVAYAANNAAVPFFAIGGIDSSTIGPVIVAGARRVAVVRALTDAFDPEQTAYELRANLEVGIGST